MVVENFILFSFASLSNMLCGISQSENVINGFTQNYQDHIIICCKFYFFNPVFIYLNPQYFSDLKLGCL
jgi:hypothetical protein